MLTMCFKRASLCLSTLYSHRFLISSLLARLVTSLSPLSTVFKPDAKAKSRERWVISDFKLVPSQMEENKRMNILQWARVLDQLWNGCGSTSLLNQFSCDDSVEILKSSIKLFDFLSVYMFSQYLWIQILPESCSSLHIFFSSSYSLCRVSLHPKRRLWSSSSAI